MQLGIGWGWVGGEGRERERERERERGGGTLSAFEAIVNNHKYSRPNCSWVSGGGWWVGKGGRERERERERRGGGGGVCKTLLSGKTRGKFRQFITIITTTLGNRVTKNVKEKNPVPIVS